MLEENERNKKRMMDIQEKERIDDLKAQEEYARMLDQ